MKDRPGEPQSGACGTAGENSASTSAATAAPGTSPPSGTSGTEGGSAKSLTPSTAKNSGKKAKGEAEYSARAKEVREVVHRLNENQAWDVLQARELPPELIAYVSQKLAGGWTPGEICKDLGLNIHGGKNSKQWRKIQAYFRQGFRADAEAYLFQQTHKFYKVIERAKEILEDAFDNGTPHVDPETGAVTYVRGATKELGAFLKAYSESIILPVKLWKDFGAIGENPTKLPGGGSPGGVTIVVKTHVPTRSQADIDAYRERMAKMAPVIDVTPKKDDGKPKP